MNEIENKVSPLETVTRYIFTERHYAKTTGRVKYAAFSPKGGKTSVFRIVSLTSERIWNIGDYVAKESSRTLRARGDLVASDVVNVGLGIESDTKEHRLHANIVGWPSQRAKIILFATKLADKAKLYLKPGGQS
jgi:hypothetical protein